MAKKQEKFSANKAAQPVFQAMHQAIKDLPNEQAIEVLEECSSHFDVQVDAMREADEAAEQ